MINYSEFEPSLTSYPCIELFHPELICDLSYNHHSAGAGQTDPSALEERA